MQDTTLMPIPGALKTFKQMAFSVTLLIEGARLVAKGSEA